MRYLVEKEYGDRNIEHDQRQEAILRNHVHDGKVLEDQRKGTLYHYSEFNIVTLKDYDMRRKLELFGKEPLQSTWDKITRLKNNDNRQIDGNRFSIKTSGFT